MTRFAGNPHQPYGVETVNAISHYMCMTWFVDADIGSTCETGVASCMIVNAIVVTLVRLQCNA